MVQLLMKERTPAWKAILAVSVGAAALLWHLLACVESPMAFSPSGEDLAFVTMEPFRAEHAIVKGAHSFRLMVVTGAKALRVLEETTDHMLSAPAYSPDGKQLCYLRMKLLTEAELKRMKAEVEKRREIWAQACLAVTGKPLMPPTPPPQPGAPTKPSKEAITRHGVLPPIDLMVIGQLASACQLPAELIVRDARTYATVSTVPVNIPMGSEEGYPFAYMYMLSRPQYSSDGQWIYLCTGQNLLAVNLARREVDVVAAPAFSSALSPDGKTLAVFSAVSSGPPSGATIAFVRTDGTAATYRRLEAELPSPAGMAWADDGTLILLTEDAAGEAERTWRLQFLKTDGTLAKTVPLKLPEEQSAEGLPTLALAPGGRHMVICTGPHVYFMRADGRVLKQWRSEDGEAFLSNPTFAPDGKRVAFKLISVKNGGRAEQITFYTPGGKEVSRVRIPRIRPGTTRAAPVPRALPTAEPNTGS